MFSSQVAISRLALVAAVMALAGAFVCTQADATTAKKRKVVASKTQKKKGAPATPDLTKDGQPNVLSHAVVVFDPNTGKALFSKNAESPVPIASITKLMTAMVVLEAKMSMDEAIIIDSADVDTIKNSRSRLPVGSAFRREDLMRLALMASDNRAAAALGRAFPGGTPAFVEAMNARAKLIGLTQTRFVDPTGLAPGNVASPQDLALMVSAASNHAMIREFSTTPELHVTLPNGSRTMGFNNTNALVKSQQWNIGLSKTGFINEAGKCLVMHATIANHPVVIVLLDSWGKFTRIGDANRIKRWLESNKFQAANGSKLG